MSTVVNNNSILKASKWIVLALFGFVFAVVKVVGLFFWNAFFGKERNNQDDKAIGTFIGADHWRADKDGYREW